MTILSVLISSILPVFAILAIGFAMGKAGRTGLDAARTINRFAMTVLVPVVVFDLLAAAPIAGMSLQAMAGYAGVQAVIFTLGYQLARRVFGRDPGEAVVLAYGGIFANNVFYGLPIAMLIYGEANVLPLTTVVVLDATLSFGGTMVVLQAIALGRVSPMGIAGIFAKTPVLQAIFLGLAASALGLTMPQPVQTFLTFSGSAAAPVALFALGAAMAHTRISADPAVAVFSAVKLVVFPAAVWLALGALPDPAARDPQFVFAAAAPTGAMALSLAILYGIRSDAVAQVMVWTSLMSLVTLAVLA